MDIANHVTNVHSLDRTENSVHREFSTCFDRQQINIQDSFLILWTQLSSWFGWKKPGFSLAFHFRLWVGSFLDIADLQQLKIAKISIFHDFRAVPAFCDVSTWSERPLDFAGNLNRAIFVRSGWFLHRWKALFKVDWECHTFRPLERTFQHRKSSLKFKLSSTNVTIDPFLEKKMEILLVNFSNFWA